MPASPQERHSQVWNGVIFRDTAWTLIASSLGLNPAVVSRDMPAIFHSTYDLDAQQAYMVLVTGDKTGDIRFYSEVFLASLMPHTLCRAANEVVFRDSNIVLNIHDALEAPRIIHLEPERLFSFEANCLSSAYIFLHDSESALRSLDQDDIVGIGGKGSDLKSVSIICGLALGPPEVGGVRKTQQIFCVKGLRGKSVRPINQAGRCTGWMWAAKKKQRPLSPITEEL